MEGDVALESRDLVEGIVVVPPRSNATPSPSAGTVYTPPMRARRPLAASSVAAGVVILLALGASAGSTAPRVALLEADQSAIEDTVSAIRGAEREIAALVYKFDESSILNALRHAAENGVRIRIVTDREASGEKGSLVKKARKAGAEIRRLPRRRGKLHAKFLIVDERDVLFGSFNWTQSAAEKNMELLVVQRDRATVKQFLEIFEGVWQESKPMGPKR